MEQIVTKIEELSGKAQAGLYQWGTGICALQYGSTQVRHCRGKSVCAGRP